MNRLDREIGLFFTGVATGGICMLIIVLAL